MSNRERVLITEYWYRTLLGTAFSINDITKIIAEFAEESDVFDTEISHKNIKLSEQDSIAHKEVDPDDVLKIPLSGFGTMTAIKGRKYHWKLHIMKSEEKASLNIGILNAKECKTSNNQFWWWNNNGYSYYDDGQLYHKGRVRSYGEPFDIGDTIHVHLDLKENNGLSFSKNDKKFEKAWDIPNNIDYKLAIGLYSGKIRITSFEVIY